MAVRHPLLVVPDRLLPSHQLDVARAKELIYIMPDQGGELSRISGYV